MSFRIFTDTSANLPAPYLAEHGVGVIPFHYEIDGEDMTCLDTEGFKYEADAYYAAIKSGTRVKTSQITPQEYIAFFEPILAGGEDLLFVGMSSGISNSYASSEVAALALSERFPERNIRSVDTLAASLGEGIAVMHAIEFRDAGLSLDETADRLISMTQSMFQIVLIEDLMHLHRGGRVSAPKALLGTVLGIRPILKGDEGGHLVVYGKVRGRKNGLSLLAQKYAELVDREKAHTVGIAYTDCAQDANDLGEMLKKAFEPKEMLIVRYEPVTGSYVGPGALALFFEGSGEVRKK